MPANWYRICLVLWLLAAGGCAGRDCCTSTKCCPPAVDRSFDCRATQRPAIVADVSLISAPIEAPLLPGPGHYCALEEREAQCLAATNAPIANLLVREAAAVRLQRSGCLSGSDPGLTSQLLELHAIQKRNEAASSALQLFFRLIEAEGGASNLERREQQVDSLLADIAHLQKQGILSPVSKSEIEGQRVELWHKQAEVQATITKLNYQLQDVLGVELAHDAHFGPQADLAVTTLMSDGRAAVSVAMSQRADLAALRLAATRGSAGSTAAARLVLQMAGAGLGTTPSAPCSCVMALLMAHSSDCEGPIRSQQMCALLDDRERAVQHETLGAVALVETRYVQIGLTKRRVELLTEHVHALEEQQKSASGSVAAVRKARLDLLAAEQDLLHDVIEWKIAQVKLKEAQGLLSVECGYGACIR